MDTSIDKPDPENVRTEYEVLSSYATTIVTFRFTLLGFYLAAVGLIIGSTPAKEKAGLLLALSICLWFLELRNRSLIANLANRGMQIEREYWGYRGNRAYDAFYSNQNKMQPQDDSDAPPPPPPDYPRVWKWQVKFPISHTQALDLTYFVVIIYCLFQIFTP